MTTSPPPRSKSPQASGRAASNRTTSSRTTSSRTPAERGAAGSSKPAPRRSAAKAAPRTAAPRTAAQKTASAAPEGHVRLNVFLQSHGVASRRKADELIERGSVKVNGKAVTTLGLRIDPDSTVTVNGKVIKAELPRMTVVFNKPDMCLTTRFDAQARMTIFDFPALKGLPNNVQAVGRLDYRSEGLLILTNDGDLAYALTHPRFSVEKTYAILVADDVTVEDIEKLRAGVKLEDGLAKAISARLGTKEKMGASRGQWIEIVVTEGRNRLIRRMAEALGLKVVRLVRIAIGELRLPTRVSTGQITTVSGHDLAYLEKIKEEMLANRGTPTDLSESGLTPQDLRKRKIKRSLKLNDTEYTDEVQRRSAEAGAKRRVRTGGQPNTLRAPRDSSDAASATQRHEHRSEPKADQKRAPAKSAPPPSTSRSSSARSTTRDTASKRPAKKTGVSKR